MPCPGNSQEDVVTARIDYSRLDRPGSPVRIRLGSTVVRVRNIGDRASSDAAEIAYFRGDEVYAVRAQRVRARLLEHDDSVSLSGTARASRRRRCALWSRRR